MRSLKTLLIVTCVLIATTVQAAVTESGCLTVTAVINSEYGNAVQLVLSPAIPGCTPNSSPGVEFAAGVNGITTSTLGSFLASGLAALATGRQVMVLYDNSTSNCYGYAIANGGFQGQC